MFVCTLQSPHKIDLDSSFGLIIWLLQVLDNVQEYWKYSEKKGFITRLSPSGVTPDLLHC